VYWLPRSEWCSSSRGRPRRQIAAFGALMRDRLTTGEVPFRKAYLGALIDRVEVDDTQVRIFGRKDVLEQAVIANGGPTSGVRSFVRSWRSLRESNPSYQIENLVS
jgi:site-specific DNA recombinase